VSPNAFATFMAFYKDIPKAFTAYRALKAFHACSLHAAQPVM
jgi:hypothetical protein